jgi:hypothetical protein
MEVYKTCGDNDRLKFYSVMCHGKSPFEWKWCVEEEAVLRKVLASISGDMTKLGERLVVDCAT